MAARVAVCPRKAEVEDAAAVVSAELVAHVFGQRRVVGLARVREERLEMRSDDAMEHRVLWAARAVSGRELGHARVLRWTCHARTSSNRGFAPGLAKCGARARHIWRTPHELRRTSFTTG